MHNITFSFLCSWIVIFLCATVFVGWHFDLIILRSLVPGAPQTTPLTAILLLFLSIALMQVERVIKRQSHSSSLLWLSWIFSGVALLIAIYTGMQYLLKLEPDIEIILYPELVMESGGEFPGRPSPQTVLSCLLIGSAMVASPLSGIRAKRFSMIFTIAGVMLTWLVLFGYASTTNPFFSLPDSPETGMSPVTTAGFLLLIAGIINLRPEEGLMKLLMSPSSGGRMVRILLPIVIIVPLMFGWLMIYAREQGVFDTALGFALNWGVTSLLFAVLIIWQGFTLDKYDAERGKAAGEREKMIKDLQDATQKISLQAEALERSNTELKQFAYIASHDLQAPLRGISGFVQLLKSEYQGRLDKTADDWIDRIIQSTQQMQTLIQDLLAYSRVDSQSNSLQKVNINDIFNEAVALLNEPVMRLNANVTRDDLPMLYCDRGRLSQLLQNLIGNALKYHGEAVPEVHVSARLDGEYWIFSVRDNGIGIDPKYREKIFEIFGRLHNQKEFPGTGIGLAVCRRIVHRHNGNIWVESGSGKGSTFYFSLPKGESDNE